MDVKITMTSGKVWEFENDKLSPNEFIEEVTRGRFYIVFKDGSLTLSVSEIESIVCSKRVE